MRTSGSRELAFDHEQPLSASFLAAIQRSIDHFLATQRDLLGETGHKLDLIWQAAHHFTQGGKRIRPAFCWWGYVAAAEEGAPLPEGLMDIASSLDLLHVSALVHDDLIDSSDTRRGGPAAHRFFQETHVSAGWMGDPQHFGEGAAILLGDLMFAWSASMVEQSGFRPDRLKRARPYLDAVRTEVLAGQWLDLIHQATPADSKKMASDAEMVMDLKTAKYTVARPAQIGAALAGADDATLQGLGRFGAHVGRAFQVRDDLLGMFGDPVVTGKPAGDDLREGKKTLLIAYGLRHAAPKDASALSEMLGDPHVGDASLAKAKRILLDCGAVDAMEKLIESEAALGMRYLHRLDLSSTGTYALVALVHAAVERVS